MLAVPYEDVAVPGKSPSRHIEQGLSPKVIQAHGASKGRHQSLRAKRVALFFDVVLTLVIIEHRRRRTAAA
jgi:hypothetical protein